MGYYTNYNLNAYDKDGNEDDKTLRSILSIDRKKNPKGSELFYVIYEGGISSKWYSHEDDLKEISSKFPSTLFILKGEGETNSDMWIKYFRNGKMQVRRAKITYDEIDDWEDV
jgi:hypothetical protein